MKYFIPRSILAGGEKSGFLLLSLATRVRTFVLGREGATRESVHVTMSRERKKGKMVGDRVLMMQ